MQAARTHRKLKRLAGMLIFTGSLALTCVLLLLFTPSNARPADYLSISGCSVSNVGYLTELAKEYERVTGVKVFVRGGGSVVGLEDLRSGKVDLAASCKPGDAANSGDIVYVQVAWDALAFIVHKSNPVDNITLDEVRSIYAGRISNWSQLKGASSPIKVFLSETKKGLSGVETSLKNMVLAGTDPVKSPRTLFAASAGIVEQMVEESPAGFATTGVTSARKRNVKILKVNGVAPTNKAIIGNRYPLRRPLFLLLPKAAGPEAKRFVDFALSRDGQQFIRSQNVMSLLDVK
jgi:phosphate transport system substrate-binding protein